MAGGWAGGAEAGGGAVGAVANGGTDGTFTAAAKPLRAAMCSGVRPRKSSAFRSPPTCPVTAVVAMRNPRALSKSASVAMTATVFKTDIEICLDITILSMIFILIAGRKHLHQPLAGVEVALPRGIVQRSALPHVLQQARTRVGYQLLKSLVDDIQMRLYATTPLRNHQV